MEVLQGFPKDKYMRAWIGTGIRFPQYGDEIVRREGPDRLSQEAM
jgi:hypothetical protein